MQINSVATGILRAHCYVVSGSYGDEDFVLVIDPGGSYHRIKPLITKPVTHIVLTHAHYDHLGAVNDVLSNYPEAKLCVGEFEDTESESIKNVMKTVLGNYYDKMNFNEENFIIPHPDIRLKDNDNLMGFKIIHTPGHTKGSICLYNEEEQVLFSGDTLFCNGYGRTDLDGNEYDLVQSLNKLMALDSNTVVYPGHNENTTIGAEKTNLGY